MTKHLVAFLILITASLVLTPLAQAEQFKILVFTKTMGWHHESIHDGITAMRNLAKRHHFALDWHEDAAVFEDERLKQYQAVVFLLTSGDILNEAQQGAMERFIRSGKGYVGIHSASDTEYDWDWYTKMVGRTFHVHPEIQTAKIDVLDKNFPGLELMPKRFLWTEEWYEFGAERTKGLNYILAVDEKTYNPVADWGKVKGTGMGKFHPVAWYHHYDGGRAFYTALGHQPATYSEPLFLAHVYGGIYWAATGKGIE